MLSDIPYLFCLICTFTLQTLANSDGLTETQNTRKSGDMPASIVLLLLFIFTSLGFICIRHIRREYNQQQTYLKGKQNGTILNGGIATKTYGSIFAPNLNSNTIDQYIDDSLHGNYAIIDRINHYRQSIQQRVMDYMEQTPEPVTFEVNNDKTVGPYCQTPKKSKVSITPIQHSPNYDPNPSPALQRLFSANYEKCQQKNNKQQNKLKQSKNNKTKPKPIKPIKSVINEDFNDYGNYSEDNDNNNDYDAIPENHAYSDSDKNLSDNDNGQNLSDNNHSPLLTKVVVLDLD